MFVTREESQKILEVEDSTSYEELLEQYKWLVKFYHPDNPETGNRKEFERVVAAFNLLRKDF